MNVVLLALVQQLVLTEQRSNTTSLLQAVSAVNDRVVWVSGHRATWARTTDGGRTWQAGSMSGADSVLQFRDVHAVSADVAYLLAAGPGALSRIYQTMDAGVSWQLQFRAADTTAFFDCFDFWSPERGIAIGDATGGRMDVLVTSDGGARWVPVPDASLPAALPGEGAFAASGTCLVAGRGGRAWIGTGAETGARVYATRDYGRTWSVVGTPVVSGTASGIATLAFRDGRRGFALGGRLAQPDSFHTNVAVTSDGGVTWTRAASPPFPGPVYGSALAPGSSVLVAVAPRGLAWSADDGATWTSGSGQAYWAVGFSPGGAGWAVGPGGRITALMVR